MKIYTVISSKELNKLFKPKMPEEWCKNNSVSWDVNMKINKLGLKQLDIDVL